MTTTALLVPCAGAALTAIVHQGAAGARRGVLIVVGGPQYRVGSHRQFVLLARALAQRGWPVLRFDYRGMGDADGDSVDFFGIDQDIRAAVDAFFAQVTDLQEVVIWGLCDAASAALFYAEHDPRVTGLVLLNPWIRTDTGEAQAYLQHYYRSRLFSADLWRKVLRGQFAWRASLQGLWAKVRQLRTQPSAAANTATPSLPLRMLAGLQAFRGHVLLILSGDDLTAAEFRDRVQTDKRWQQALQTERVVQRELAEANHTFASRRWRDQVADWTGDWLASW